MSAREMIAAVAAVLVAAYVVWRWRKLSFERRALGIALVLALGIYASGVLSTLPDPKKVIEDIAEALGAWTYALVAVAAFLETGAFVGLVAPGETIVMAAGVVAGQGTIDLLPLIGIVWLSAVLGDTTSFFIGKRLGRRFLEKHGPRFKITEARLKQVESYFDRHGGKTILIGRFIGLVRALAPFIAGSSGLPYRRFIPYSIVGTGLWSTLFCTIGYLFYRSFDKVAHLVGQAVFGFGVTVAVIVGVVVAYRRRHEISDWFTAHERHPLVRPLLAVARPLHRRVVRPVTHVAMPYVRFAFERISPGGLGLEFTTLLAIAGVGIFVFVTYLTQLAGDPGPTAIRLGTARPGRPHPKRHARGRRQDGHRARRVPDRRDARGRHGRVARSAQALRRGARAGARTRAHLHRGECHQGRARAGTTRRRVGRLVR